MDGLLQLTSRLIGNLVYPPIRIRANATVRANVPLPKLLQKKRYFALGRSRNLC